MTVERLSDGLLELGTGNRRFGQTLQQNLSLVEEAGRAIAALKRKVFDKGLLQRGELAALRMAFDGADRLAVKTERRGDASRAGVTGAIGIVDDDGAAQALRGSATELGAGHAEIFAQEIVHREIVAHIRRSVRTAVDRDAQFGHASTPLS